MRSIVARIDSHGCHTQAGSIVNDLLKGIGPVILGAAHAQQGRGVANVDDIVARIAGHERMRGADEQASPTGDAFRHEGKRDAALENESILTSKRLQLPRRSDKEVIALDGQILDAL